MAEGTVAEKKERLLVIIDNYDVWIELQCKRVIVAMMKHRWPSLQGSLFIIENDKDNYVKKKEHQH